MKDTENTWTGVLKSGENVLWQGRPDPRVRRSDIKTRDLAMGGFFTAFSVFWMIMALRADGFLALFGLPFFVVGLRVMLRAQLGAMTRRYTWYTLTDRRAFVATALPWAPKALNSFPISADTVFDFDDAELPPSIWFTGYFSADIMGRPTGRRGFERIGDAQAVYAQMRAIQRKAMA